MGCANAVRNALNDIDGVLENQVTLDAAKAQVPLLFSYEEIVVPNFRC